MGLACDSAQPGRVLGQPRTCPQPLFRRYLVAGSCIAWRGGAADAAVLVVGAECQTETKAAILLQPSYSRSFAETFVEGHSLSCSVCNAHLRNEMVREAAVAFARGIDR